MNSELPVQSCGAMLQVMASPLGGSGNSYRLHFCLRTEGGQAFEDVEVFKEGGDVVRISFTVVGEIEATELFDGMAALSRLR